MKASLRDLFDKYLCDKGNVHGYERFYPKVLEVLRDTKLSMLEIGADRLRSYHVWNDYFSNADVFSMEKTVDEYTATYPKIIEGDQSKIEDLMKVVNIIKGSPNPCRFIIDDGSHVPSHQITSFNCLFNHLLEPGGIYIIEDIETSYWRRGDMYGYKVNAGQGSLRSVITAFLGVPDVINREYLDPVAREALKHDLVFSEAVLAEIESLTFGQNCIIIVKRDPRSRKFTDRAYRYAYNTAIRPIKRLLGKQKSGPAGARWPRKTHKNKTESQTEIRKHVDASSI